MNLQQLKEQHPDLVSQIETEARAGMINQAEALTAQTQAVADERTRICGLVGATMGEAAGARLAKFAEKGLTAADVADMGLEIAPGAVTVDMESRSEILKGLHSASPEGVKTVRVESGAEGERSAAVSKIAAGGSKR